MVLSILAPMSPSDVFENAVALGCLSWPLKPTNLVISIILGDILSGLG